MKKFKNFMSVILAVVMILSTFSVGLIANAEESSATDSPLSVTVSTDKNSYGAIGTAKVTVTITNNGEETVEKVSAEALFDQLSPLGKNCEFTAEADSLEPGESIDFSYSVTLNQNDSRLNFFLKFFLMFKRVFYAKPEVKENGFDDGRACLENVSTINFGGIEAENVVRVWYVGSNVVKITPKIFALNQSQNVSNVSIALEEGVFSAIVYKDDEKISELKDNGDLSLGDDIANDGVYSTKIAIDTSKVGVNNFCLTVENLSGDFKNYYFSIEVYADLSQSDAQGLVDIYNDATLEDFEDALESADTDAEAEKIKGEIAKYFSKLEDIGVIEDYNLSEDGNTIYFTYLGGISGAFLMETLDENDAVFSKATSQVAKATATTSNVSFDENIVGNNKALILSSFESTASDTYIGAYQNLTNKLSTFKDYNFGVRMKYNATVEDYHDLIDEYGMIFINSHGKFYDDRFPVICLEESCTALNIIKYRYELWHGLLVTYGGLGVIGGSYAITPDYISFYHENTLPNSLVYMCICHGMENNQLANAFLAAGAETVTGFTDTVQCDYDRAILGTYVDHLLDGKTASEARQEAIEKHGANDADQTPAAFVLRGNGSLKILNTTLINPSFEMNNFHGWVKYGDVRTISKLGSLSPQDGNKMAIISTGLGAISDSNSGIEQTFKVPDNCNRIVFDYDFVSEEPLEFVNSSYDDKLFISIIDANGKEKVYVNETINTSTWIYLGEDYFNGGDETTYHTGWTEKSIDVSSYKGQFITFKIRVCDIGDSKYDTAVLVDNIIVA
ncbi:MAG: choice-of-anchor L domain-containing protein [Acutalibacteraceae bacterium]|nr:choice-of-anchor L domain-containing protein [Acutalibacteraceae bacterium]